MAVMLVGSLAFASLTNSDILLAKYFLDDDAAGVYAAAALVGKAVLFLPAAVVTVLLPKAASRAAVGATSERILFASAAVTLVLTLGATALLALVPESLLVRAFGGDFRESTALLGWFGLAMTAAALVNVYLSVYFAERDVRFPLLVLAAAVAQVVGISVMHEDARSIVMVTLVCATSVLVLHELFFPHALARAWRARRRRGPPTP
jgi:O-antigen/teichoic acid export membrane protein